jgi:hypothetical protein
MFHSTSLFALHICVLALYTRTLWDDINMDLSKMGGDGDLKVSYLFSLFKLFTNKATYDVLTIFSRKSQAFTVFVITWKELSLTKFRLRYLEFRFNYCLLCIISRKHWVNFHFFRPKYSFLVKMFQRYQ